MPKKYVITLNEEEYDTLLSELNCLIGYRYEDDHVDNDDSVCKSLFTIEKNCEETNDESECN